MANQEHLKILKQGVEAWNKWRGEDPETLPDLSRADLGRASLGGANLAWTDLCGVNLGDADLNEANLICTNLNWANLSRVTLGLANLMHANLGGAVLNSAYLNETALNEANLIQTNLVGTILSRVFLRGAKISGAVLSRTILADVDLSCVQGLEAVRHEGPSEISISTIYRSGGKIPVQFLRGAGVPDNFIEFMSSLVGTAFDFYSCFISYSTKNQEFADRLYADLQAKGVRCWFAPHNVQGGKKLHEQIDTAIRLHERLLLILSPDSINSEWVKTEIAKARKREIKEGKRVLFPIRLNISFKELEEWECFDADRGKDSAREIREYYIPDFTQWKDHDQYQKEFDKLLRDLKKGTATLS
jgi:uncharacterized protein YjbI with pentapeptide repeats